MRGQCLKIAIRFDRMAGVPPDFLYSVGGSLGLSLSIFSLCQVAAHWHAQSLFQLALSLASEAAS